MEYFSKARRTSAPPLSTAPYTTQHPNPGENDEVSNRKSKNPSITSGKSKTKSESHLKTNANPGNVRLSNARSEPTPSIAIISETTRNDHSQKPGLNTNNNLNLVETPKMKADAVQSGLINYGYVGSTANMHTRDNRNINIQNRESYQVYREQYWSWSLPCTLNNWSKREKILLLIVTILSLVIFGLVAVVSVLADKNNKFDINSLPFQPWRPS